MTPSLKRAGAALGVALVFGFVAGSSSAAAQSLPLDTAQVSLQGSDIPLDGHLTFSGRGFAAGEATSVSVEDGQGNVQATLEPVTVQADGQFYTVSVGVPGGLAPGAHALRVAGLTSGHVGHAAFTLRWQTPSVHLEAYTAKPTRTLVFDGSGFVPSESVDVFLGDQQSGPLATVSADGMGDIGEQSVSIPIIDAGDYKVTFVGRASQSPVSVGFNIQAFHPWVVLHNYYLSAQDAVGFSGEDFVPGETVLVYLNSTLSSSVAQITADGNGRFSVDRAVPVANLTGDNQLIFVGQQSQTQQSATFKIATP